MATEPTAVRSSQFRVAREVIPRVSYCDQTFVSILGTMNLEMSPCYRLPMVLS